MCAHHRLPNKLEWYTPHLTRYGFALFRRFLESSPRKPRWEILEDRQRVNQVRLSRHSSVDEMFDCALDERNQLLIGGCNIITIRCSKYNRASKAVSRVTVNGGEKEAEDVGTSSRSMVLPKALRSFEEISKQSPNLSSLERVVDWHLTLLEALVKDPSTATPMITIVR